MKYFIFLTICFSSFASQAATLSEAIESSWSKLENERLAKSQLRSLEETLTQARGALYPTVSAIGSYQLQDLPEASVTANNRRDSQSARLGLTQPLFRGGREFAALRAAESNVSAGEFDLEEKKRLLTIQVVEAYYDVLAQEKDREDVRELQKVADSRLKEIKGRVSIGRSRRTESLSASAQIETLTAQLEILEGSVRDARTELSALTGLPIDAVLTDQVVLPKSTEVEKTLKPEALNGIQSSVEARSDIKSSQSRVKVASELMSVARGGHWPSLDASANYYPYRTGVLEPVKWDLGLTLTLPLFQGGITQSQVRAASEVELQAKLKLEQNRRLAVAEIQRYSETLAAGVNAIERYEKAVQSNETSYKESLRDYRNGLMTNLEAIQSLNLYTETLRSRDRAIYQAKVNWLKLRLARGEDIQ